MEHKMRFERKMIRKIRQERNMTLLQCGNEAGIDWQNWQRWELGTSKPSADNLAIIAEVLHCEIKDLYDYKA